LSIDDRQAVVNRGGQVIKREIIRSLTHQSAEKGAKGGMKESSRRADRRQSRSKLLQNTLRCPSSRRKEKREAGRRSEYAMGRRGGGKGRPVNARRPAKRSWARVLKSERWCFSKREFLLRGKGTGGA